MTNELANQQMCIYLRNGIEIWVDKEIAMDFGHDLEKGDRAVVKIGGQYINSVEVVGIFDPIYLDELKRRKLGQYKCKYGKWHNKEEDCECGKHQRRLISSMDKKSSNPLYRQWIMLAEPRPEWEEFVKQNSEGAYV